MADAIINGQDPASVPVAGRVTDVPDNFKQWVSENEDRIQDTLDRGKELPYFLRDNDFYWNEKSGNNGTLQNKMALINTTFSGVAKLSQAAMDNLSNSIIQMSTKAGLFPNTTKSNYLSFGNGTLMEWNGKELTLTLDKFKLQDGYEFSIVDELRSASSKLRKGKELTFYEEYSIESLYHEFTHTLMNGRVKILHGSLDETILETCTQLYARERYNMILESFGVKAINQDQKRYFGLGYRQPCNILRGVFSIGDKLQLTELLDVASQNVSGAALLKGLCEKRGFNYEWICDYLNLFGNTMIP